MTGIELIQNLNTIDLGINMANVHNVIPTPVSPVSLSQDAQVSLVPRAARFQKSLNSGVMLVRSRSTGALSSLNVADQVQICADSVLSNYNVRDKRVEPKQNYSKIDPGVVNIYAHKGPDEQPSGGTPGGGMAL